MLAEIGTGIHKTCYFQENVVFFQNIPDFSHFSNIHEMSNHMLTETAGSVDNCFRYAYFYNFVGITCHHFERLDKLRLRW